MNMTARWLLACLGTMLLSVSSSNVVAAPIFTGGQLIGATDVNVGGTLYDVEFLDGTCVDLFSGCDAVTDFNFQTVADAASASQALLDQVFLDGAELFDSVPSLTNGCSENEFFCEISTPHGFRGALVTTRVALNADEDIFPDGVFTRSPGIGADTANNAVLTWARWSVAAASPVPEPGSLALVAIALGGLMVASPSARRRPRD